MPFEVPKHLIVRETEHWIVNHRVGASLPGYLMIGSRAGATNLFDLPPEALSELGLLMAAIEQALHDCLRPDHIYLSRYGHTPGHTIHFHVIPIYGWVREAFAADSRYRVLRSFYTPGVETSDPDGGELTLFVWREFCESKNPPRIQGPTVAEAIQLLRDKLG
jgi:diadenosine tetraphosphate (Ap4A) HIT family hydrolase